MAISYSDAAHLLRRSGFGGTQAQINALTPLTLEQAVDTVLATSVNPPTTADVTADTAALGSVYWVQRMATVPAPIQEKMTLFWHGLFVSGANKVRPFEWMWEQNELYRNDGMGNVVNMAQKMATGRAMLLYLDNKDNGKAAPNENFARELMELFTLGVDQYTQSDVTNVARSWTGHTIRTRTVGGLPVSAYYFDTADHDTGNKTIFGITKNWNGPDVINEIYTGVKQSTSSQYLARRLWTFFAGPAPSDTVLNAMASAFVRSGFDIRSVLRVMFLRPEFYSTPVKQGLLRSPIEFVAATTKYTGVATADSAADGYMAAMGQRPFLPPNVSGWRNNEAYIGASNFWARARYARLVTARALEKGLLGNTAVVSPATAVRRALDTFAIDDASVATKQDMEAVIVAERAAGGGNERAQLVTMTMLSPEFAMA